LAAGASGPLKAPFVMDALCRLGTGGMRDPAQIGFLFGVARVGPGYQCDLELPRGADATAVIERSGQLSAALRRKLGCVWPYVGKRHQGHLVLSVADQSRPPADNPGSMGVYWIGSKYAQRALQAVDGQWGRSDNESRDH
jgi:hypothetical protein